LHGAPEREGTSNAYPDHDDKNPSWRWDAQNHAAHCTCSSTRSIFDVVMKKRGVSFDEAKLFVADAIGRRDLIRNGGGGGGGGQRARGNSKAKGSKAGADVHDFKTEYKIDWKNPQAIFRYHDAEGNEIYHNVRFALLDKDGKYVKSSKGKLAKTFLQRRSDEKGGWIWRLKFKDSDPTAGVEMVPYRLPDVIKDMLADRTVPMSFVEGEAKADRLRKLGFAATSIQQGCKGFGEYFDGGNCYILPDNDEAGEERARFVAEGLRGHAASINRLDLPGLPPGGDILDWIDERLAAGKTEAEISDEYIISVDNLNGELGGDMHCQLVERQIVSIRILGETRLVDVECRATVFANGNNLTPRADVVRRTIMCGLDANMENPELRTFTSNPLDMIMADRGRYIAAALTIVRAFIAAGRPITPPPLASYDEWSMLVRAPLMWRGREDPVKTQESVRKNDPDALVFAAIIAELGNLLGPGVEKTVGEIKAAADEKLHGHYGGDGPTYLRPKLRQVLLDHAGAHGEIDHRKLDHRLGRFNGRVIDQKKLVGTQSEDKHQLVWKISTP
jgi:hypothetical protein